MTAAVDWLARRAQLSPGKLALLDPERGDRISYREWNRRADRMARGLVAAGVGRGDRVAVLGENAPEVLDLLFACGKLGAVFVPLNWRLADPELERILAHARPRILVADAAYRERAAGLARGGSGAGAPLAIAELAARGEGGPTLPAIELAMSDPWVVCYTGGSTGTPKGVVQTHGSITWNAINTAATWGIGPEDAAILNAPLFHTGGLHVLTTPLVHVGGTSIVCRRFDPAQVLALLDEATEVTPTLLFGVPTMFLRLVEHPRFAAADLSRLRLVISGGAPAPARLFASFFALGVAFRTGYGLTEAGPNNFWLPAECARDKAGSVGWPLLHIEARLVADHGGVIEGADQVGELQLRGPHVMAGYLDEPGATADVLSPSGWLATGDLARRDADGAFWIVGRVKDMFISGGENVYPAEVEDVLCDHPAVLEAAVVGAPHPEWGEIGVAFVALRPASPAAGDAAGELARFLAGRLASYKLPRRFELVAELPRTGAGKVDRSDLRRRAILIAPATSASNR
ncbi:MAG TPA: AMP-binding protein [Kofleriaceae bacterium]|nr:AMP-binding protein [Kofleriaceae bacterium]